MFQPVRVQAPPLRPGIPFPGGPPLNPVAVVNSGQGLMTATPAQGMANMAPPPPHCPPPNSSQPSILPGRAVLLPSFRGALPGFPPLPMPMPPPPTSPPPLPPSPPAEVPPPPPTPEDDSNSANFAPPPMIPQDPEVVKNIEVLAEFVVRNGPRFERMTISKQGSDPKFAFLFGGDPGTEAAMGLQFYEWKKNDIFRRQCKESGGGGSLYAEHVNANVGVPNSKQRENKGVSPARSDMDIEGHGKLLISHEPKRFYENTLCVPLLCERVTLESKESCSSQQTLLVSKNVDWDKLKVAHEVRFTATPQTSRAKPTCSYKEEASSLDFLQEKECTTDADVSSMEDVSPEASPFVIKKNLLLQEVEVQSSPKEADNVFASDADIKAVENVELVANYKRDGSSSSTSSSKEEKSASPQDSDRRREIEETKAAFQEDMPQECCVLTGDEFGRLVREGGGENDAYERLPEKNGMSKSKSRSCSPEDLRRSWSRSPPRGFSKGQDCTSNKGLPYRGRKDQGLPLCIDYVKGKCFRGASCRFVHQEFDSAADDNDASWSKVNMEDQREILEEEESYQNRTKGSPDKDTKEESLQNSEGEQEGKNDNCNENYSPIQEAEPKHISSTEDDIPSDPGCLSPKAVDDGCHLDSSLHSLAEEIQATDEQKILQTALSGTVPEFAKVLPRQTSLHLQKEESQSLEEQQRLSVTIPESTRIMSQQATSPPLAALPSKLLSSIASFPQQSREQGFGANTSIPQQPEQPREVGFGAKSLRPQLTSLPGNPLVVHSPASSMNQPHSCQPFASTSLPHQSNSSLGHSLSQQPVLSAALWPTPQPVLTGVSRMPQPPALGMNMQAGQPRFDEASRFMQQSGPTPFPRTHLQSGFASHSMHFSPLSNTLPPLGPYPHPQPPISASLHNVLNISRQETPTVPVVSQTQTYPRNQLPAPVPLPVYHQSGNFTYSTLNTGRAPMEGLPSKPQQQKFSQEPYDPLADSFEPKPPAGGLAMSNFLHGSSDKNGLLNSQQRIDQDETDALEICNRILSAARAGKHVFDTVAPKPENGLKRSPLKKFENLLPSKTLIDEILSRPSVNQGSRVEVEVGTNKRKRLEQLELYSPVYAVEGSEDVLGAMNNERQRGTEETDTDKQTMAKSSKEEKQLKVLKMALTDYVKEVLKPTWREGHLSKEAFKTIAKKAVDKILSTLPEHHIPKGQDKVDRFIISSQEKISKLVQGYLDKYVKQ